MDERHFLFGIILISLVTTIALVGGGVALLGGEFSFQDSNVPEPPSATAGDETTYETQFVEVAEDRGLEYAYQPGQDDVMKDMLSDAGVFVVDYNNDGYQDVLLTGGERPRLFSNENGTFVPSNALPEINDSVTGALFFDHDNDGYEDLLLLRANDTPLFLANNGSEFTDRDVGIDVSMENPVSASAADVTGNGCLDVFVVQNGNWDEHRPLGTEQRDVGAGDNGNPNYLFYGDCSSFSLAEDAGIEGNHWSLATSMVDLTGDGNPDIHVGNDFNHDILYVNQGDGTFERTRLPDSDRNAMSSIAKDITGNGNLDIFVTNVYFHDSLETYSRDALGRMGGNNLFVKTENGEFVDKADPWSVQKGGWGWGVAISDFDNDGQNSILQTTLRIDVGDRVAASLSDYRSAEDVYRHYPYIEYPMFFDRTYDSRFATPAPPDIGLEPGSGRGAAELDVNNDGTMDIIIAKVDVDFKLYENQGTVGNSIQVDVRGHSNMTPIGSEVTVTTEDREQHAIKHSNADFLSQSPRTLHFGVGSQETVDIVVTWPDGTTVEFEEVQTDQRVAVSPDGTYDIVDRNQ